MMKKHSSASTAADQGVDLDSIACLQLMLAVPSARNELLVHLDGHLFRRSVELREEIGHGRAGPDLARLSVADDFDARHHATLGRPPCAPCPRRRVGADR